MDAPYREIAEAIAFAKPENLLAVEMEAVTLYAFAEARRKDVMHCPCVQLYGYGEN